MKEKYLHGIFQLMKIMKTIKVQLQGLSTSISRFPVSTLLSFILFILLVMLNERPFNDGNSVTLERMALVTTLGFFLSISITHLLENYGPKLTRILITFAGTLSFMTLYYLVFLQEINNVTMIRTGGTLFFFIISVFYTLKTKNDPHYERYVMKIFSGFFITFLYAAVLFLGIAFIIVTINALFDANIDEKWYLYTFYASTFIFGSPLLLSKLPRKDEVVAETPYSRVFRALLLYIIIPLIVIYTVILYIYFIQILITMEWPRGLVSNLVLWYAALSVGVIFFINPLAPDEMLARLFKVWFPRAILPVLIMMFVSIGQRIGQYGFTESRYYVVLLGLFILVTMGYFAIVKNTVMIFVPMALSLFVLISVYGPASALEISYLSQNQRLTSILESNNMLVENTITPKTDISEESQKNISSIVNFFINRDIDKMKYVDESFTTSNFTKTFGFTQTNEYEYNGNGAEYFYLSSNVFYQAIPVKGYDYLFNIEPYGNVSELDGYTMTTKNMTTLVITKDNTVVFEEDLKDELIRIITSNTNENKDMLTREESLINHQGSDEKIRIYLRDLSGRITNEIYQFDNMSLIVLFNP